MSERRGFPDSLRSSAVPRWSHRDPVECDNPFTSGDARRSVWHAATRHARDSLVRLDAESEGEPVRQHADYPMRVVDLAVARFDIWSERLLSIVYSSDALQHYQQWLVDYTENWLHYVEETCPKLKIREHVRIRLTARSRFWVEVARRSRVQRSAKR